MTSGLARLTVERRLGVVTRLLGTPSTTARLRVADELVEQHHRLEVVQHLVQVRRALGLQRGVEAGQALQVAVAVQRATMMSVP